MYDFHMHSIYSDGIYDEFELLEKIKEKNIKYFSLTDHDTIIGSLKILNEHSNYLKINNLHFLLGAELSTSINNYKTHLLAYNFDYTNPCIELLFSKLKELKWQETLYRLEKLQQIFNIQLSKVSIDYLKQRPSVTKPNIAQCMKNEGFVTSKGEAIKEYIDRIPKKDFYISSKKAIDLIHLAGGKIFLAHPFGENSNEQFTLNTIEPYIKSLVNIGIDGMECYYFSYDINRTDFLLKLAKKYDLLVSCGSDCHGSLNKYGDIGQVLYNNTIPPHNDLTILQLFNKQ